MEIGCYASIVSIRIERHTEHIIVTNGPYFQFDDDNIKYTYFLNDHKSIRDIHCCGEIQIEHVENLNYTNET